MPSPSLLGDLLHIFFPSSCPACGRLSVAYCDECLDNAVAPLPPFCAECGGPYGVPCCHESVPCFAAAPHEGDARAFVLALKYRNARSLGRAIGERMAKIFARVDADCVVPLPLHKGSSRAYNQTELIARAIASHWNMPVEADALRWAVRREPQTSRNARDRIGMPREAFAASQKLCGRRVVLVDDVYTTGGTVRAALSALRNADAIPVAVMLWTRRMASKEPEGAWPEDAGELL